MKKKQLGNLFTVALLLSTPLFASEDSVPRHILRGNDIAPSTLLSNADYFSLLADFTLNNIEHPGLTFAKQFGINKKESFINAARAQFAVFMQKAKIKAAIAAGTYAAYDAVKMVPAVNVDDSATMKTVKYAGKAVVGSSAFATQFAAIKFLVSNWNVLLHPMQDKVKTAKVLAVALANIAYYTPQVRALVVKAASYIDSNVFVIAPNIAPQVQGPVVTEDQDGASTSSDESSTDAEYFEAREEASSQEKEEDSGIQEEAKAIRNPNEIKFINDAINACDKSSNSPLKKLFSSALLSCNDKEYIENYKARLTNIYVLLELLPDTYASESVGMHYMGTSEKVRALVNSLLKHYMVNSLTLTEDCPSDKIIINTEITRIITELENM